MPESSTQTTCFAVDLELALGQGRLQLAFDSCSRSVGVYGPSGAGKTSLLEALAGWRRPTRERVCIAGVTMADERLGLALAPEQRGLGYLPQEALLFPHWNAEQNITAARHSPRASHPAPARAQLFTRVVQALDLEPLLERYPRQLSGGEARRVALARALCGEPRALLLDEPLVGLDPARRAQALALLLALQAEFELPLLVVSHQASELEALCETVVLLEQGRLVAQGAAGPTLRRAARGGLPYDNLLRGRVLAIDGSTAELELAPACRAVIPAAGLVPGEIALFTLGAEEVLLSVRATQGLSARNALPGRVLEISAAGDEGEVLLELCNPAPTAVQLVARVTLGAIRDLRLAPGTEVWAVFKTRALRRLASQGTQAKQAPLQQPAPRRSERPA